MINILQYLTKNVKMSNRNNTIPPNYQAYSANNRFVQRPYTPMAYPYDVSYPAYVYPKINNRYLPKDKQVPKLIDNRMKPYFFQHYLPPSYYELWDYDMQDNFESQYNESLRKQMVQEVNLNPGVFLGQR
jgi:hypothetical protein